uniref:Integrase catalytic domain-containing protein n=1 Tax=Tanacetum cinerariifolium TaxID=118510 RepID=A0A699IP85_TANCI|nr:hypothetical protein [Tanacetum cinerariifolium]
MLEKHQLTGPNFNVWFRALKLVVRTEKLHDVFETALPPAPIAGADAQALEDWAVLFYRHNEVACLMLGTMSPKLFQQFKHNSPLDMAEGQSVNDHVLLMKIYPDQLAILNYAFSDKVSIHFILNSLSSEFQALKLQYAINEEDNKRRKLEVKMLHPLLQGLRGAKKLKRGSLYLYVGNGVRAKVEAIGSFDLVLPNGLIIVLDNCHYAPSITRGVVSVSRLADKGFTQCFTDFGLSVLMNNMLYFNAITVNGIYEIDMRDSTLPIVNSMYSISNKRTKSNLDSTYLWHCRLAHINKKRIEKLQHDGLLKSTNNEPFDQFLSCISDMCQRKVFKSEVENQLKNTIKSIRSDRGGEYISPEFNDHIKAYGIVQQLTPPYTPQHNGVSERRNHTLLNMETMGYYFYYPPENKIVVERYVDFLEKDFILQKESGRIVELENEDILPSENTSKHPIEEESLALIISQEEDAIPVHRSVRIHKAPGRLCLNVEIDPDRLCFNVEVEEHSLGDLNEPANYKATLSDPEFEKWLVAMNAEMQSMYENKILIAIAAYYDYEIWQMDVKTAFLNGFLEEEIYMEQPEGFIDPNHPRKASGSNVIFRILYVDDIILMENHIPSLQEVKTYLDKCFSLKDLGEATFILGIKIYRDRSRRLIGSSQNKYLDKILKRYRMDNSKRGSIPMQVDLHLSKSQSATTSAEMKHMQNVPYASVVGSIMYDVRCTRPDVAFSQNITSRFQQNSGEAYWTDVKNILNYLRNTKDTFLVYGGDPEVELRVNYYYDAGFETDRDDTKSQTGHVFILNGGAVVWKSSKQSTTAQHAT